MPGITDLQRRLLRELSSIVAKRGFEGEPSEQAFYIRKPFGRAVLHLAFIQHDDTDFDVTIDVALRIDAVEDLINEGNKLASKTDKVQSATLGCELGNLSEGKQRRWRVAGEDDIRRVTTSIQEALELIAFPYIEQFSNLDNVFAVLSSNSRSAWLHSPIHGARCQRVLALAYVLGKYDQLDKVINESEVFLKSINDFGLKTFQQFASKIRALAYD